MSTFTDRTSTSDVPISTDINTLAQGLPQYLASRTYEKNVYISDGDPAIIYLSLVASNVGNTPASSPTKWEVLASGISGLKDISFPAGSWNYETANPAPLDTDVGSNGQMARQLFDDTTEEFIVQQFVLPSVVDAGTVTFEAYGYSVAAATGKNIELKFYHSPKQQSESWDAAYSSKESGDLATNSTQDVLNKFTWTETIANLGWVANDQVRIKLSRIAPSVNNLSGDWGLTHFRIILP